MRAATRVVARKGFHAASVDEIAGFSTGALYSNFEGKEDLFLALFDQHVAERITAMGQVINETDTPAGRAHGAADQWMAFLRENRDWFLLFIEFWAYAIRDPKLRSRFANRFASFREAIATFIEDGARQFGIDITPQLARQLGTVVNALGNGIALEKLASPEAVPDELFGDVLALLFSSTPPGPR